MPNVCEKCKAPIEFVVMATTGKRNPVDVEPNAEKGNIWKLTYGKDQGKGLTLGGPLLDAARAHALPLHLSHFATCPEANHFRGPKRGG